MIADYQSTAHITGFADDVPAEENASGTAPKSEILEQLKLRMPWNQPAPQPSSVPSSSISSGLLPSLQQVLIFESLKMCKRS